MSKASPIESFRTHKNYLEAFSLLAGFKSYTSLDAEDAVFRKIASRARELAPQPDKKALDLKVVRGCLANAWSTELLMSLTSELAAEDEFVRITNNWSAVQAYYVAYHAIQALCVAKGMTRPDTHPKTLKQYNSFWLSKTVDFAPWTVSHTDKGFVAALPDGISIDKDISPWTICDYQSSWSLVAKALKTTRDDAVRQATKKARDTKAAKRRREWQEQEDLRLKQGKKPRKQPAGLSTKPTLDADEKDAIDQGVRPHSIVDYLYRLRIRSNYEDSTMFLDGPETKGVSAHVRNNLRQLASSILLIHEKHIESLVGTDVMGDWVSDWISKNVPESVKIGLPLRAKL